MKKIYVNLWPTTNNQLALKEFIFKYGGCTFDNPEFRYTDRLNEDSAIDLMVMANADRLITDLKSHHIHVVARLSHSTHPNYKGYLFYIESKCSVVNINPIVAKYFTWERIEHQDAMKYIDFANL